MLGCCFGREKSSKCPLPNVDGLHDLGRFVGSGPITRPIPAPCHRRMDEVHRLHDCVLHVVRLQGCERSGCPLATRVQGLMVARFRHSTLRRNGLPTSIHAWDEIYRRGRRLLDHNHESYFHSTSRSADTRPKNNQEDDLRALPFIHRRCCGYGLESKHRHTAR